MDGERKGSFIQSTAALMTGVGTLLAALVALGAFFVGQQWFADSPQTQTPQRIGPSGNKLPKLDEVIQWGPGKMLLTSSVDLDAETPDRTPDFGESDAYMWSQERMSASYGMAKWSSDQQVTQNGCANLLDTHGTSDEFPFDSGDRFCVRTGNGRVALFVVQTRTPNGWELEVTVWKQKTT